MSALLRVELTRLRWRRAVLLLVVTAVAIPTLIFGATAWNTRPVGEAEQQRAQRMVEDEIQSPQLQRELSRCVKRPGRYGVPAGGDTQAACESQILPRVEWYTDRPPLSLDNERESGSGSAVAVVLTMLLLLLGTTFVGHDWNSGSMSNQLLFEPRRLRVWAAKGLVVLVSGVVVAGVVLTAYWTGLWLLSEQRDLAVRDGALADAYQQALRASLLAGFAGLGGYAATMLFRSTVATLGILFGVAIAGPLLLSLLAFPGHQRLMPQHNFAAVLLNGHTVQDYNRPECYDGVGMDGEAEPNCLIRITTSDASLYFGGLLLLAGVPSLLSFRRRDVP